MYQYFSKIDDVFRQVELDSTLLNSKEIIHKHLNE